MPVTFGIEDQAVCEIDGLCLETAAVLTLASSGFCLAILKSQSGNIIGRIVTFYLITTAWLTGPRGVTGSLDRPAVFRTYEKGALPVRERCEPVLLLSTRGAPTVIALNITSTSRCLSMPPSMRRLRIVHGKRIARHTSAGLVRLLAEVIFNCPATQQVHIILDNLFDLQDEAR